MALALALVAGVSVYALFVDPSVPVERLVFEGVSYEKVRDSLLNGENVIVRSPIVSSRTKKPRVRNGKVLMKEEQYVSYGRVPHYMKLKLEVTIRSEMRLWIKRIKAVEEHESAADLLAWHKNSMYLAEAAARLDMLVMDEAFVSDRWVELTGYESVMTTIPSPLYIDEKTGLAVNPKNHKGSKLKLGEQGNSANPVVMFLLDRSKYEQIGYHEREMKRIRGESSVAQVFLWNSLDITERKRRYEAYQKLRKEFAAIPRRRPKIRAEHAATLRQLVPDGITVHAHKQYHASRKRGWK